MELTKDNKEPGWTRLVGTAEEVNRKLAEINRAREERENEYKNRMTAHADNMIKDVRELKGDAAAEEAKAMVAFALSIMEQPDKLMEFHSLSSELLYNPPATFKEFKDKATKLSIVAGIPMQFLGDEDLLKTYEQCKVAKAQLDDKRKRDANLATNIAFLNEHPEACKELLDQLKENK